VEMESREPLEEPPQPGTFLVGGVKVGGERMIARIDEANVVGERKLVELLVVETLPSRPYQPLCDPAVDHLHSPDSVSVADRRLRTIIARRQSAIKKVGFGDRRRGIP